MLRNLAAKAYYVGQSVNLWRRWAEWKNAFATGIGFKNRAFAEVSTRPEDWDFVVVQLCPASQLDRCEKMALAELRQRRGIKLINNENVERKPPVSISAKSVIVDGDRTISISEAAQRIGCKLDTLRKRLKKYRHNGHPGTFDFDFLKNTSTIASI
jgi:hypothetical protein